MAVEQAPSVSTPSLITDNVQRFELAKKEPPLRVAGESELKKALQYVFLVVGIRGQNLPSGPEKEFLHAYILNHFGGHTAQEIRQAFDMAVQGLLDLDPRDVKCYENFSILYFATIMKAYRAWAVEQARRLERVTPPALITDEQKKQIDAEYLDYLFNLAFKNFQTLNKLPTQWPRKAH